MRFNPTMCSGTIGLSVALQGAFYKTVIGVRVANCYLENDGSVALHLRAESESAKRIALTQRVSEGIYIYKPPSPPPRRDIIGLHITACPSEACLTSPRLPAA